MNKLKTGLRSRLSHLSLRRIVTSNRFISEVDGFRFVAIFVVILTHVYGQCGPIPNGSTVTRMFADAFLDAGKGVFLFFTISGFILALPFARQHLLQGNKVNVLSYFRRRLTRLEPPYVLAMLLRASAVLRYKHEAWPVVLEHLTATLFYVHGLVFGQASTINPPAWSLEVEIQFYVLAPLLTAVFLIPNKVLRRTILVGLILASGTLATLAVSGQGRFGLSLACFFQYFLAGFLLCDIYLTGHRPALPGWVLDVLGTVAIVWILHTRASWYPIVMPFAIILLYLAGFYGVAWRAFFSYRPISLIGGMCYSIYLTHSTVLTAVTPLVHRITGSSLPMLIRFQGIFVSSSVAVLLVGTIYFVLIERPCMDPAWPNKLAMKFRGK